MEASGLLRRLTERGHQVEILSGTEGTGAASRLVRLDPGVSCRGLSPFLGSRWKRYLRRAPLRTLSYLTRSLKGEVTYRTKLALRRAWRQRLEIALLRPVAAILDGEKLGRWVERWLPADQRARSLVEGLRPDVVVSHSAIYAGADAEILKIARRARIPTVLQFASFDTLTAKGGPLVRADHVAVWGDASRAHAIERHGFRPEQVVVTGPPLMDMYGQDTKFRHWSYETGWWNVPYLVPGTRPILIAGTSLSYWSDEHRMVHRIADWAQERGLRVWYRPHPRHAKRNGPWPDHRAVTVDTSGLDAPPAHYRRLLEAATCVVTAFSTMVIEAALMGKPSLIVAFGASTGGTEFWVSDQGVHSASGRLVDHAGFEHMADVIGQPGVRVCRSEAELFDGLEKHTQHPMTISDVTQAWAARIAHCLDGQATARMIDLIERVAPVNHAAA